MTAPAHHAPSAQGLMEVCIVSAVESAERVSGASLVGVPAFDFFVWALDNYGRGELLVKLHNHLPSILLNPGIGFVCMCAGLGLLYLSYQRQMRQLLAHSARPIVDNSGTEYRPTVKAKWPQVVAIVFLLALVTTPTLAVIYSLAYEGTPPVSRPLPSPPPFAYISTPKLQPHQRTLRPPAPIINAPGGIPIVGNKGTVNNPTVNNFAPPSRHLDAAQIAAFERIAEAFPATLHLTIYRVNEGEAEVFSDEIAEIFSKHGKIKPADINTGLSWTRYPHGIGVLIHDEKDEAFETAQSIANTLASTGGVQFARKDNLPPKEIRILVGGRPE